MSTEENKAMHHRFGEELFNKGNFAVADELLATNLVDHNPFPGQAPGPEGVKQIATMLRAAFPDIHFTWDDKIVEGDKAVIRSTMRGTHKGEFLGIPATGKQVAVTGIDIVRIEGGKIVEHWGQQDTLGMMQQLGATSPPGQGG